MNQIIKKTFEFLSESPAIAIFWTALILLACNWPADDIPKDPVPGFDKIVHIGFFTGWAILWRMRFPNKIINIIAIGITYGFIIEVLQHILPFNRTFDLTDLLADTAGIFLGLVFYRYIVAPISSAYID